MLEMDNRSELADRLDSATSPGDRIWSRVLPPKQQQSLYIMRLDRPSDGFNYEQIGNRPSIGSPASRPR